MGLHGHCGTEHQGITVDRLASKMVLGNPDSVETELLDQLRLG